ncbi:hypothetical protein [Agromyces sp. CF514]|uniref:hypothetical protein n=1 Tax=Agromyces sp. CF514 TaxID=1881031 RepID=UPI0011608F16|nr:hypothetical protein [Agromyces sp. CF514]
MPDDEAMFAPRSDARSAPQQARIGPPPSAIGEHADPGMHSERGDARFVVEPEPESESPFVRHPSLRYWVALVASIGFVLTGAVLYWNINLMQMSGMMTLSSEEQALQSAVYSLSSGFMQAGVVGVVLVVGLWAVQTGRGRS